MARGLTSGLTGRQRAAILMVSMGPDASAKVFQHLRDDEIEQLTLEIANLRKTSPDEKDRVLLDFHELCQARDYITQGGISYAKEVLEKAVGAQKASEIIHRLTSSLQVRPFDFVRKTDPHQLINFIQNEHPQTIALILAYLTADQAAVVLSGLPAELQVDVARRLAIMERTSPDVLREVENVLERKLSSLVVQDFTIAGGIENVVETLTRVDRTTEKTILEALEIQDPDLAEEIRKRMFVFEDIIYLDDRSIQIVVRQIDNRELAMALKVASDQVKDRIFKNITKRMAEMLKEEMDYMGPVRMRDVEDAQQKIVNVIRKLEDAGEIIVARGGGDEIVV